MSDDLAVAIAKDRTGLAVHLAWLQSRIDPGEHREVRGEHAGDVVGADHAPGERGRLASPIPDHLESAASNSLSPSTSPSRTASKKRAASSSRSRRSASNRGRPTSMWRRARTASWARSRTRGNDSDQLTYTGVDVVGWELWNL
jgi:hypothetical protein